MEKIDNGLNNYLGLNEQRKLNGQVYSLLLFVSGLTIKLNFNISKVAYCCCKTPSTIFTGKRKAYRSTKDVLLCTYQCQAQGEGGPATHGNLTVTYLPRVGILIGNHAFVFDLSVSNSRREVNCLFLPILAIIFCPGVGIWIICFS